MAVTRIVAVLLVLAFATQHSHAADGSFVLEPTSSDLDVGMPIGGRRLHLITYGLSLAQRLAEAIANGNIDEAARILIGAVRGGDSDSVRQGLFLVTDDKPGIAQTIVRALGLGLKPTEAEAIVESTGPDDTGPTGVVHQVLAHAKSLVPNLGGSLSSLFRGEPSEDEQPVHLHPPPSITRTFVNGEEVRECRGTKEEQCCEEYDGASAGCLCEYTGECRFQFISTSPVIIIDTRRTDQRACSCA